MEKMEPEGGWEIDDAILGRKLGKSRKERERCEELDIIGRLLLWLISAAVVEV